MRQRRKMLGFRSGRADIVGNGGALSSAPAIVRLDRHDRDVKQISPDRYDDAITPARWPITRHEFRGTRRCKTQSRKDVEIEKSGFDRHAEHPFPPECRQAFENMPLAALPPSRMGMAGRPPPRCVAIEGRLLFGQGRIALERRLQPFEKPRENEDFAFRSFLCALARMSFEILKAVFELEARHEMKRRAAMIICVEAVVFSERIELAFLPHPADSFGIGFPRGGGNTTLRQAFEQLPGAIVDPLSASK